VVVQAAARNTTPMDGNLVVLTLLIAIEVKV